LKNKDKGQFYLIVRHIYFHGCAKNQATKKLDSRVECN